MKATKFSRTALSVGLVAVFGASTGFAMPLSTWVSVVNSGDMAPDASSSEKFFSFNQPSVNDAGLVAFRARAKAATGAGGSGGGGTDTGGPLRGIFTRDMAVDASPITTLASNKGTKGIVPQPNNQAGTYNEFPAFPRLDARTDTVAFRGQSKPVLEYQTGTDPNTGEPTMTKGGTSGVYTNPSGVLATGASLLGNVNGYGYYQVPGTTAGTKFDQFPGSPTATGNILAFKGNWTDPATGGQTGIYFRDVVADGGLSPVQKVAVSGETFNFVDGTSVKFGSTAPPSASDGRVVFTGLDNEDAPTAGGIFLSALSDPVDSLKSLVRIGVDTAVNWGQGLSKMLNFKQIGEALSFDGKFVGFWGAWGSETKTVTVNCASDGNADMLAACKAQDNNGIANDGTYTFEELANQGIFVVNTETGELTMKGSTNGTGQTLLTDFLFWTFSGAPDSAGGDGTDDREPPRWRSSAFVAVDDDRAVFKGLSSDGDTGLYGNFDGDMFTVLETGMDGSLLDADNPEGAKIATLGIERDGFRNGWLAINASMLNEETGESWAGIYVTQVPEPSSYALVVLALGALGVITRRRARG